MSREERQFSLLPNDWENFDNVKRALDHDSDEETLKVLIELGFKAIAITDSNNRTVNLMGGQKKVRKNFCKKCGEERDELVYPKQMSLQLGVDEKSLKRERESQGAKGDALDQVTEFMDDSPSGD